MIAAGIAPECYSTPNIADVNMGPRYSSDGAVQYVLSLHPSKIVFDQSNVPGTGYIAAGPAALAKSANVPITQLTENVPINDANSVALKEVDDAGPNGAVVLNFTPPEALVILQAAQKLGIENRVKAWACSTPCDTDFLAKALGSKWNGKFFVNAELTPPTTTTRRRCTCTRRSSSSTARMSPAGSAASARWGSPWVRSRPTRWSTIKGPYTAQSVNAAFLGVKDYKTGMLCQPWTYGNYPLHIANNTDYTVTPDNGKMVIKQGCTAISSVDPQIAAVPQGRGRLGAGGDRSRIHKRSGHPSRSNMLVISGILGLPSWQDFQPFLVTGLALGGVYALSGVGMVVLYRATGVLNLAFGAVGAMGALIAWQLINQSGWNEWLAYLACVLFGGVLTLAYGMVFGPALAERDPLVKATATLGLTLILLGVMDLLWTSSGGASRVDHAPDRQRRVHGRPGSWSTWTHVIALVAGPRDHGRHRGVPALHEARHGDAGDGRRPRDHRDARRAGAPRRGGRLVRLRGAVRARRAAARRPRRARRDDAHVPRASRRSPRR